VLLVENLLFDGKKGEVYSMSSHSIALIIPALNEEQALEKLLMELPPNMLDFVIVVDNGSTDRTAQVASNAGAQVVSESQRGYGRACWSGFCAAKALGADILVFMDGDGSDNPADLSLMLQPMLDGQADLVIGSRVGPLAERGAVPPQARLGNWLVSRLMSVRYGLSLHDVGSFRVVQVSLLETLQMSEMTFGWPVEMLAKSARAGYRIVEVPLRYRKRSHGRSKVAGTLSGSLKAAYLMLRTTLRYIGIRRKYA
jgi:glycosyltransferase involved in cell wall biosynthesis